MNETTPNDALKRLHARHSRLWRDFQYVYPVISRRSKGLSVGVNLNPDKVCNWDCVYCQVDRTTPPLRRDVDLDRLREELDGMLTLVATGAIWNDEQFADVPAELRRVNDIAFSGDGEPTTYVAFDEAVNLAADLRAAHGLADTKLIVLSNMTMLHRPRVVAGLERLHEGGHGEIWAKLDAGDEATYAAVDRSAVSLERVLENIAEAGRRWPIVIQSMFMRLNDTPPTDEQITAYIDRLAALLNGGARIKLVQLYTIARDTAEAYAAPLTNAELDALAARLRDRLPELTAETYYGVG